MCVMDRSTTLNHHFLKVQVSTLFFLILAAQRDNVDMLPLFDSKIVMCRGRSKQFGILFSPHVLLKEFRFVNIFQKFFLEFVLSRMLRVLRSF